MLQLLFKVRFNMPMRPRCQALSRLIARMQQETPDHPDQRLKPATGVQRFAKHPYLIYHPYMTIYDQYINTERHRMPSDAIGCDLTCFDFPCQAIMAMGHGHISNLRILRRLRRPLCWASDPLVSHEGRLEKGENMCEIWTRPSGTTGGKEAGLMRKVQTSMY